MKRLNSLGHEVDDESSEPQPVTEGVSMGILDEMLLSEPENEKPQRALNELIPEEQLALFGSQAYLKMEPNSLDDHRYVKVTIIATGSWARHDLYTPFLHFSIKTPHEKHNSPVMALIQLPFDTDYTDDHAEYQPNSAPGWYLKLMENHDFDRASECIRFVPTDDLHMKSELPEGAIILAGVD